MSMTPPTPDQITMVETNLSNMIDLNDTLHDYAQDVVNRCYILQAEEADYDPGLPWAMNLAIAMLLGGLSTVTNFIPAASNIYPGQIKAAIQLGAAFGAGVFREFAQDPVPSSLDGSFATVWARFSSMFLAYRTTLTAIHDSLGSNPSATWSTSFTDPQSGQSVTVGDLASAEFPAKDTVAFQSYLNAALDAFQFNLWRATIPKNFGIQSENAVPGIYQQNELQETGAHLVRALPPSYVNFVPRDGGYMPISFCLSQSPGSGSFGFDRLGDQGANLLFIDDGFGTVLNKSGLAYRADVFNSWGLFPSGGFRPQVQTLAPAPLVHLTNKPPWQVAAEPLPIAPMTGVPAMNIGTDGSVHVFARGDDGRLQQFYQAPGATTWANSSISDQVDGHTITSDPVVPTQGGHVYACDSGGHLVDFAWSRSTNRFILNDVSAQLEASSITGTPGLYQGGDGSTQLFARSTDGNLVQFYQPANGPWALGNVPPLAESQLLAADPCVLESGGSIYCCTVGGHLLVYSWVESSAFQISDLSASLSAPTVTGVPAALVPGDGSTQVFVRSSDGQLVQFYRDSDTSPWALGAMPEYTAGSLMGNPIVAPGGGHVFIRGTAGQLLDFSWVQELGWQIADVSTVVGGRLLAADPLIVTANGQLNVYAFGPIPIPST